MHEVYYVILPYATLLHVIKTNLIENLKEWTELPAINEDCTVKHLVLAASKFGYLKTLTYWRSLILTISQFNIPFLAHLSRRLKVRYCDRSLSVVRPSVRA